MTIEIVRNILGWSAVINIGFLWFWAAFLMLGHDFVYRWHSRWINLSVERFDELNYQGIMYFKLFILFFNVVPYLAIRIVM